MFRLSRLKEIRHELNRARALATELDLLHLANTLTANISTIQTEISQLEKQKEKENEKTTKTKLSS